MDVNNDPIYETLVINRESGQLLAVNMKGEVASEPSPGMMLLIDRKDPYRLAPTDYVKGAVVNILGMDKLMPRSRIRSMFSGPLEQFRSEIGFADATEGPQGITVAVWTESKDGVPRRHEMLLGGPEFLVEFPVNRFRGLDGLNVEQDTMVKSLVVPSSIRFRPCSNVTPWVILHEMFPTGLSSLIDIDWDAGNTIYGRFSIKADPKTNNIDGTLTVALEALILPRGEVIEDYPEQHRNVLNSGSCRSFLLWNSEASWYAPSSRSGLVTTPGIYDKGGNSCLSDSVIRWHQASYLDVTRRGRYCEAEDWYAYLAAPYMVDDASLVTYSLVVNVPDKEQEPDMKESSTFAPPKGNAQLIFDEMSLHIHNQLIIAPPGLWLGVELTECRAGCRAH